MFDPSRYSIVVRKVEIEGELNWRATVKELPDLVAFGDDAHAAYDEAVDAILDLYDAAKEEGRPFPTPERDDEVYSGRITLRMPPSLHARVAQIAAADRTSLNQYIVLMITAVIGAARAPADVWNANTVFAPASTRRFLQSGGLPIPTIQIGSNTTRDTLWFAHDYERTFDPIDIHIFDSAMGARSLVFQGTVNSGSFGSPVDIASAVKAEKDSPRLSDYEVRGTSSRTRRRASS